MPVPWTQLDIHIPACSLLLQRSKCLFTEPLHIYALPQQFDSHHVSTSALPFMSWHYCNRESLISRSTEHILLLEDRMSATTTCAMSMDHLELKWLQGQIPPRDPDVEILHVVESLHVLSRGLTGTLELIMERVDHPPDCQTLILDCAVLTRSGAPFPVRSARVTRQLCKVLT